MKKIVISVLIISFLIGIYGKNHRNEVNVTFDAGGSQSSRSRIAIARPTDTPKKIVYKANVLDWQKPIAEKIAFTFKEDADTAIAVFRAESGLRPNAQGWNCSYGVCENSDRKNATSTDCGIAQINFPGSICPAESFNEDWNIKKAHEMYTRRGFQPWSAYNAGKHLVFLTKNGL